MNNNIKNSPVLLQARFSDIDQLNEAARGWDVDFRQMSRGGADTEFIQMASDDIHIAICTLGAVVTQTGTTPKGMRTFAFRNDNMRGVVWRGKIVDPQSVLCFDKSKEFGCDSPGGFSVATISLSEELIDRTATKLGYTDFLESAPCGIDVKTQSVGERFKVDRLIRESSAVLTGQRENSNFDWLWHQDRLAQALTMLLIDTAEECSGRVTGRARVMREAVSYIKTNARNAVTVAEICAATGVSWRTLDRAFGEHLGISPKECILASRLHGAYRDLKRVATGESVSDIANAWGFWHLGNFAAVYRREFGELPSRTLARH